MKLGRVIGTVVPALVCDGLAGVPLLWVQPLTKSGEVEGSPLVCADPTRMAGPEETVYWVASREAALTLEPSFVPVDHAIVGITDDVQLDELPIDDAPFASGAPEAEPKAAPMASTKKRRGEKDAPAAGRRAGTKKHAKGAKP
jgi:ethanolamine utilization protein EutN